MAKIALGKGLGALINTRVVSPAPEVGERVQAIRLSEIVPTPLQPRSEFRPDELAELVNSVREHGIIQPLIARRRGEKYELIAGERRWRAAKEVGLDSAPVIVREASDQEVLELALIENLQRADLNPIEEAMAFARLAKEFGLKQEEIALKVGKHRATVANSMRLLDLHSDVQNWLAHNRITVGHAKVLLGIKSHEEQRVLAEAILRNNHTVRAAEEMVAAHLAGVRSSHDPSQPSRKKSASQTPAVQNLQNRLQQHFSTHVVVHHAEKKGKIEIEYYGLDDLHRILNVVGLKDES